MSNLSFIRSIGDWLNWSVGDWLNLMSVLSISVVDLLANLLGESELNILASRSSKLGDALLRSLSGIFNLWDSDALLLSEVLTADSWERDWLVDTGLDWLRVGNLDSWLNNGDNRDVVASLLGNLLAVVVSVSTSVSVSISILGRLADGDHLSFALLVESNLNSLGGSLLTLRLVRVGADLVVDLLNALGTDSTGDCVALLDILYVLTGEFDWVADCFQSWGAHFSSLDNILDGTVVLGVLITIAGLVVGRLMVSSRLVVGRLRVGRLMVGGLVVCLGWNTSHKGHKN